MENNNQENPQPNQPVAPKKSNNVVLIILAVVGGLFVLGSIVTAGIGWLAFNKVKNMGEEVMGEGFNQAVKEWEKAMEESDYDDEKDSSDEEYDRFAQDDVDYADEHGGRVYATKHGLPEDFPESITIVQPSELKHINSQAKAKGETPVRWHIITESEFATVAETKAAIEAAYADFGEMTDRTAVPGGEAYATENVMLSYTNEQYSVSLIASQETEYKKGPVGNFLIVYDVVVR